MTFTIPENLHTDNSTAEENLQHSATHNTANLQQTKGPKEEHCERQTIEKIDRAVDEEINIIIIREISAAMSARRNNEK